ncbi:hypothetical protein, partial [Desulfobacter sp.]|uniref:hypothetical protein n=1 Tax=Desulfobacter sp. TaxID=2294 RepID=UPI003D0AEFDA
MLATPYVPVEHMGKALRDLEARSRDADTELTSWSPPVPVKLAAAVSRLFFTGRKIDGYAHQAEYVSDAANNFIHGRTFLLQVCHHSGQRRNFFIQRFCYGLFH